MLKKTFLILLFLAVPFCVFSLSVESVKAGTGNDLFSLAVSDNYDDQLSFNLFTDIKFDDFMCELNLDSYTRRYTNRLDVVSAVISKLFDGDFYEINPKAGFIISGDMKLQGPQSVLHKLINIPLVELDYDYGFGFTPLFGTDFALVKSFEKGSIAKLVVQSLNALNLYSDLHFSAEYNFNSVFTLGAGYRLYRAYDKSETLMDFEKYANGFETYFSFDTGFFSFNHYATLESGFGFGEICFDIIAPFNKLSVGNPEKPLTEFSGGNLFLFNMGKQMPKYKYTALSFPVNEKLSFYIDEAYLTGFDMIIPDDYVKNHTDRNFRRFCFVTAGAKYNTRLSRFFTPSIGFGAGALICKHVKYDYTSGSPVGSDKSSAVALITNLRADFNVLPENFLRIADTSLNLDLYAGSYMVPSYRKMSDIICSDSSTNHASLFIPYIGFAVSFGI